MEKKRFIKESKSFCMLPWVHTHILPSSNVKPCCVCPYNKPIDNVKDSSIKEIWNNEEYKNLRKKMLNGESNENCNQCYEREASKGMSLRQTSNLRWEHLFESLVVPTMSDGELKEFKMAYLDIRFSNICNFKCRGCSPELSSAWKSDYDQMYDVKSEKSGIISIFPNEKLWTELESFLPTVEAAYFAGGEPLIMDEHYFILESLIRIGKTDIPLSYNSNLSNLKFKNKFVTDYWKYFKHVEVGVSIDDFGMRGEYFRHGMNWEKTLKNIEQIKKECPHVIFSVNCTVSLFNVSYLPELHEELLKNNVITLGNMFANILVDPIEYRVQLLPKEYKEKIIKKLRDYVSIVEQKNKTSNLFAFVRFLAAFNSVINLLESSDETENNEKFINRNKKLDEIRNEKFEEIYPELAFLTKKN